MQLIAFLNSWTPAGIQTESNPVLVQAKLSSTASVTQSLRCAKARAELSLLSLFQVSLINVCASGKEQLRIVQWINQRGQVTFKQVRDDLYHRHRPVAEIRVDLDSLAKTGQLTVKSGV
jgi:hypothetical protein